VKIWPLHAISSLFFVLFLGGCIPVAVPIPVQEKPYEEAITNVQVGITRKDDVISQFGDPDYKYFNDSEFVYTTFAESWKVAWAYFIPLPPDGASDAGVETLYKRHVMKLSFDANDILSEIELDTAGDDFGDCTKAGICFGAGKEIIRYADAAADEKAKEFSILKGQCSVYFHGAGNNKGYRVQLDDVYANYKLSISNSYVISGKSFIHWTLNPSQYNIKISPDNVFLPFSCQGGENHFIHFEHHHSGSSTIQLEDKATGRQHTVDRRLVLLPSRVPQLLEPAPGYTEFDSFLVNPEKAHLVIIKPGMDPGTLALDGIILGWVKQPDRYMSVWVNPGNHTLVFAPAPSRATQAIITVMAEATQSHFIVLETSSSSMEFRHSLKLLDMASGLELVQRAELLPATGPFSFTEQSVPVVLHSTVQAPGGAWVDQFSNFGQNVFIDNQAKIGTGVQINPGVHIGKKTVIEKDVRIGKEAKIGEGVLIEQDTLIGERAIIGASARLRLRSIICPDAQVGASADIGTNVTVQTEEVVPDDTRIRSVMDRVACKES